MNKFALRASCKSKRIGFVPTMGFLHEGHLSLIRKSKKENDLTVLSIFVNPTQFGPREDFSRYPRDLKRDESLARNAKVDIIFYPTVDDMYPGDYLTYVDVPGISEQLCGKFRPGHFKGVVTVVSKLVNIVQPDVMYLGQKDAQQAVIIKRMLKDLNFPVKVKVLPTVREKDGLAMSSRNSYLNPQERSAAPVLFQSLKAAEGLMRQGERQAAFLIDSIRKTIQSRFAVKIDYIECVDAETLTPLQKLEGNVLIALAVWFGQTRLIDNIIVRIK